MIVPCFGNGNSLKNETIGWANDEAVYCIRGFGAIYPQFHVGAFVTTFLLSNFFLLKYRAPMAARKAVHPIEIPVKLGVKRYNVEAISACGNFMTIAIGPAIKRTRSQKNNPMIKHKTPGPYIGIRINQAYLMFRRGGCSRFAEKYHPESFCKTS